MQALPPRLVAPGGACKSMASAADTGDKRVLIVDDSKFVRTTFNRILSASFSVVEAVDGDAAWKAIQSDPAIAMVFSDLDMPKLDGYGLLRLVRGSSDERIKKLPVVVISGSQDKAAQSRARQAGANDFISKSAEAPDVLSRIEGMLRAVNPKPRPEPLAASQPLARSQPIPTPQQSATQQIATLTAATQQALTHDTLTGALAPQSLVVEARKHFSHARRHGAQLSVMTFRVDSYAQSVRDAGKGVADQVLARIAKLIMGMLRAEESLGRVSEATFMVISAGSGAAQVLGFARRLHGQLETAQVKHGKEVLKIRSSFGLASLGEATASVEDLMKIALQRLQAAANRPGEPIVGEPETAAATPVPAAAVPATPAAAAAPTPAAATPAAPGDIERALELLERADPKQLGEASEAVLRGFLDKIVTVLAAKEIAKVSI
jgi:diguanylate cyclase (GGDEF)-like protein